jgi:hypothetical protein
MAETLGARRGSVDRAKASNRAGQLRSSESLIMDSFSPLRGPADVRYRG